MLIPFPIKSTIETRRSVRSYKMTAVDDGVMADIKNFAQVLPVPFDHNFESRFFRAEPTKVLYPLIKSPPDNIAFMAETDNISISKAGFAGELLILFAWSKNLCTCWYGHYRLAELERLMPHLQLSDQLGKVSMGFGYSKNVPSGKRAICLTPLGYHEDSGLRLMDRITKNTINYKRKDLIDLLENPDDIVRLSDNVMYALELGRKAPSAVNSQMWRFGFEDAFNTITVSMPVGYQHFKWAHPNVDIGICACHVWLGLIDKGCLPSIKVSEENGRAVWRISI